MKRSATRVTGLFATLAFTSVTTASAVHSSPQATRLTGSIQRFLDEFGRGDQPALERFIENRFDPEVLRTTPAGERADRLARLFVDSGGFEINRIVRSTPEIEVVVGRAKHTDLLSCLTLRSRSVGDRTVITDFTAVDLPLPSSPTLRTPSPREVARTTTRFMERLSRADTFAGVFLVAKDGRVIVREAYGKASLAYDAPIDLDTRFNIASIGKSITAVVIGQLLDDGRLTLDDKVGVFLPDYPDVDVRDQVTIRHLLTHTSGLGAQSEFTNSPLWPASRFRIRSIQGYLPLITGHPLESEPGSTYAYSNAGFVILGLIIERVTGRSYYEVVADEVFAPAGMTHSFFHEVDHEDPNVATGLTNFVEAGSDYTFQLGPRLNATLQGAARGGSHGGAYLTADDLLRFMTAVREGRLTTLETASLLTTPQGVGRVADMKNGLGFEITSQNGHSIVGHTGGDIGVSAFVYHFNETGYSVVVLSNYDPRAIRVIARLTRGLLTRSVIGATVPIPPTDCSL